VGPYAHRFDLEALAEHLPGDVLCVVQRGDNS
jgi:hypothetical protein